MNFPVFVAPIGKGAVSEQYHNYGGVYVGNGSHEDVAKVVEGAGLVLSVGAIKVRALYLFTKPSATVRADL